MLATSAAYAGAKIQVRPQHYLEQKKPGIDLGVAIWQPLFWRIQANSWIGGGVKPGAEGYKSWMSANAELEARMNDRWSLAFGAYFRYNPMISDSDNSVGVKTSYRLW